MNTDRNVAIQTSQSGSTAYGRGMFMVHPAGQPLSVRWRQARPIDVLHIRVPPAVLAQSLGATWPSANESRVRDRIFPTRSDSQRLADVAMRNLDSAVGRTPLYQATLAKMTSLLLGEVYDAPALEGPLRRLTAFEFATIIARLAESVETCPSMDELADEVALSDSYLTRVFKAATGRPPKQFHLRLRLEVARELIRCDAAPLRDIAQGCGFADQPHMTRRFAREFGITPKRFADKHGVSRATDSPS